MKGPLVIKYGGSTLIGGPPPDPLLEEIAELWRARTQVVLLHGGGPEIDRALEARGIESERVAGQRVTDAATLEVAEAVLCGTINKRLVRACLALGVHAAGISGEDASLLVADRMRGDKELGFVGEIVDCNPRLLEVLLQAGILPIVAPLAVASDSSHAYNVNADLAAAAIASALKSDAFILVTNVARVRRDPEDPASGIDRMTPLEARAFAVTEACRSSMKPKVLAAAEAVARGAKAAYICSAGANPIRSALAGEATIIA